MTCACEWKDGKVISCCGAHWEYIRHVQAHEAKAINADLLKACKVLAKLAASYANISRFRAEDLRPEAVQPLRNAIAQANAAIAKAEGKS